ncbi:hypothetical protein CHCC15290_4169 [Bacillus licheniformis]|jgi:hypothetical protein|uniref:Uncharacterized protein n=1 Tax=Bacillus licheniformis TaxID=1402 RepID=A0A8B5YEF4_BACLI|nr:hypothetical protein N399_06925 [Bacillus licheniformis CG-B52]KUL07166.1 hypothetical protein LI17339_19950 [Bacillus licheniformis LMG 17339]KYC70770.1 hypothetical protein B4092_1170 [Bacillus licheniformis]KYC85283.1 hypothetical protein B4091_1344 [Bacillus licheniformis]KYC93634.1 hypothetical protein B4164_0934 [Bacillus licheniformis]
MQFGDICPAEFPDEHQSDIHGKGAPSIRRLMRLNKFNLLKEPWVMNIVA